MLDIAGGIVNASLTDKARQHIYDRTYYERHAPSIRARKIQHYHEHPEYRERSAQLHREWLIRNRDKMREYERLRYKLKNGAARRRKYKTKRAPPEYFVQYRLKNLEKCNAYSRKWRAENPDKVRLYVSRYGRNHPERLKAIRKAANARRKAIMRGAVSDEIVSKVIRRWLSTKRFTCYYCHKEFSTNALTIDHIVPIASGGSHSADNICKSCLACNCRKQATPISSLEISGQSFLL